jgi:hypothetical protein
MPKIHFLETPKIPRDMVDEWEGYVKDSVHDVSVSESERWLSRGVAEIVTASVSRRINQEKEVEKEVEVAKKEEVKNLETATTTGTVSTSGTVTTPRLVPRT